MGHPAMDALQAKLLAADNQVADATSLLRQKLLIHPQDLSLRETLSRILIDTNRPAEAIPLLKDLTADYPQMPFSWSLLSEAANAAGDQVLAYRALGESYYFSG